MTFCLYHFCVLISAICTGICDNSVVCTVCFLCHLRSINVTPCFDNLTIAVTAGITSVDINSVCFAGSLFNCCPCIFMSCRSSEIILVTVTTVCTSMERIASLIARSLCYNVIILMTRCRYLLCIALITSCTNVGKNSVLCTTCLCRNL